MLNSTMCAELIVSRLRPMIGEPISELLQKALSELIFLSKNEFRYQQLIEIENDSIAVERAMINGPSKK